MMTATKSGRPALAPLNLPAAPSKDSVSRSGISGARSSSNISTSHHQQSKNNNSTGPWRCLSYPELPERLENHLYAQPSRLGPEKWLKPESIVGTEAWRKNGGRKQNPWLDPERDSWVQHSTGNVKGNPSRLMPPTFGKPPTKGPKWVSVGHRWQPPAGTNASLTAIPQRCVGVEDRDINGFARKRGYVPKEARPVRKPAASNAGSRRNSIQRSGSFNSLDACPSKVQQHLTSMQLSYPPSPAFIRYMMRHLPE
mmetsp:Transcript_34409/g.73294  ORF Transcript_34409/g.73294 Transcript_34409/m.73294 type:complete len:254 (-) Transcript_34409:78-839(-)